MTLKLVTRVLDSSDKGINQCWAKVLRDTDTEEYRVKFYRHAEYLPGSDYYTSDKGDAIGTARVQCLKGY